MKKITFAIFFLVLTACSAGHYYEVKEATLSLYLRKDDANRVLFASSLDGYQLHEAIKIHNGTWQVRVSAKKEFKYFYIVDGIVHVPPCRMREIDDFGSENCIYVPGM